MKEKLSIDGRLCLFQTLVHEIGEKAFERFDEAVDLIENNPKPDEADSESEK